jgi:hypothetical protein
MRRLFIITAVVSAVSLGGCATLGSNPTTTQIDQALAQVQAITKQVCGIIPYAESVAQFVASFTSGGELIDTAASIANQLCAAFTRPGARRGVAANGDITFVAHGVKIRAHR